MLRVFIPPGRTTGYHTHTEDSVSVNIVPAERTMQNLGSEPTHSEPGQRGRTTFTAYSTEGPRTHKATNIGQTPFHNVSFILGSREAWRFTPSSRASVPGYVQVMDNACARLAVVLEPGESAAAITQTAPGIRIVLDGGELVESVPGQADRGWMVGSGEFYWQEPGLTRGLRNIGKKRVEILEFELK